MTLGQIVLRAQIFTNGHADLVRKAYDENDKVLIIVGSAYQSPDIKNPFDVWNRIIMINKWISQEKLDESKFIFKSISDNPDEFEWRSEFNRITSKYNDDYDTVTIYSSSKDNDQSIRSEWINDSTKMVAIPPILDEENDIISATRLRKLFFTLKLKEIDVLNWYPKSTGKFLKNWIKNNKKLYQQLRDEYQEVQKTIKKYGGGISLTSDVLIHHDGKVLLIRRGGKVGYNQLAMAGGFVDENESFSDAAIRECKEELNIDLSNVRPIHNVTYGDVDRDLRGRVITTAYLYDINDDQYNSLFNHVFAQDDAKDYEWISLSDIISYQTEYFADHFFIINELVKKIGNKNET